MITGSDGGGARSRPVTCRTGPPLNLLVTVLRTSGDALTSTVCRRHADDTRCLTRAALAARPGETRVLTSAGGRYLCQGVGMGCERDYAAMEGLTQKRQDVLSGMDMGSLKETG